MHIIVCMKQVPDLEKIRIKADTREPVLEGVPLRFGDFDKNALEEAVRIKEKLGDAKVTVVSIGTTRLKDGIKEALAIGADEAVILTHPLFEGSDATGTASGRAVGSPRRHLRARDRPARRGAPRHARPGGCPDRRRVPAACHRER